MKKDTKQIIGLYVILFGLVLMLFFVFSIVRDIAANPGKDFCLENNYDGFVFTIDGNYHGYCYNLNEKIHPKFIEMINEKIYWVEDD